MKKKTVAPFAKGSMVTLAALQAFGLFGVDFTAEEIQNLFSKVQTVDFALPTVPNCQLQEQKTVKCSKCGKKMRLCYEPGLMTELVKRLNNECEALCQVFELDDSRVCPHCGDGRLYLKSKKKFYSQNPLKAEWEATWSESLPVSEEDLLMLLAIHGRDHSLVQDVGYEWFHMRGQASFVVATEAEFKKRTQEFQTEKDENIVKFREEREKRSAIFQSLTEKASVLRRENLEEFLTQLNAPQQHRLNSRSIMLTRMMISLDFPQGWERLTCPNCKNAFYLLSGTNTIPTMTPLGDLQEILHKLDVTPDFSSLCPCCHPDQKNPRLRMKVRLDEKEYPSEVSPSDLALLVGLTTGEHRFTAGEIKRLRAILQGAEDDSRVAAMPVSDDEESSK